MNINDILDLPKLDDISLDISYVQMPLSLFCKKLGIDENSLKFIDKGNIKEIL